MTAWNKLVEEGKRLVAALTDDKMALGDLIIEACGLRKPGGGGRDEALVEYAEAIDITYDTARHYRLTAAAWPKTDRREGISYSVYRDLRDRDDRIEILDRLIAEGGPITRRRVWATLGRALDTVEARPAPGVEAVRQALADPEIADQVFADDSVSTAVDEARSRQWQRDREAIRQAPTEPVDSTSDQEERTRQRQTSSGGGTQQTNRLAGSVLRVARAVADIEQAVGIIEALDDPLDRAEFAHHFDNLRTILDRYDEVTSISDEDIQAFVGGGGA